MQRFTAAQHGAYERALAELREGEKRSHWMWYIFPQLRGLGTSAMAHRYGVKSLDEARAYLRHPLLGPRLIECTEIVAGAKTSSASSIFPYPDNLKFHSSMTLFAQAADEAPNIFGLALGKFFGGQPDRGTLRLLGL